MDSRDVHKYLSYYDNIVIDMCQAARAAVVCGGCCFCVHAPPQSRDGCSAKSWVTRPAALFLRCAGQADCAQASGIRRAGHRSARRQCGRLRRKNIRTHFKSVRCDRGTPIGGERRRRSAECEERREGGGPLLGTYGQVHVPTPCLASSNLPDLTWEESCVCYTSGAPGDEAETFSPAGEGAERRRVPVAAAHREQWGEAESRAGQQGMRM